VALDLTRRHLAFSLALSAPILGLAARTAPAAESKALLTISGKIAAPDGVARMDRDAIERLGLVSFETTTPWHNGKVKFEGVPMSALLREVGANGTSVQALALNDYSTEIPIDDFKKYGVILALKRDGEYMPVRDKGPLFVVYPYDSDPELKSQKYYSRSVWQVKRMEVR
jgi:hypothetical protein